MLNVFQLVDDKGLPEPEGFDLNQGYLQGELINPIMLESEASKIRLIDDEVVVSAWDVQYEADALPQSSVPAWNNVYVPDPLVGSTVEINPAGILHTNIVAGEMVYWVSLEAFSDNTGVTMQARLKLVSGGTWTSPGPGVGNPAGFHVYTDDSGISVSIWENTVNLSDYILGIVDTYTMDTTDDYHVYKVYLKSHQVTVEIDGVVRLNYNTLSAGDPGTQGCFYSGNIFTGTVEALCDYIYYKYT